MLRSSKSLEGTPKALSDIEILTRLGINAFEEEAVKGVSAQLTNLQAYGVVKSTPKGWMWVE